jgi:hypothetical protein
LFFHRALNLQQLLDFVNTLLRIQVTNKIEQMTFPQFLEKKYLEWQQVQGGRKTVAMFANYLGVKQSTLSMWWNSGVAPSGESIRLLAEKLGIEVYDILGEERPDEDLHYIERHWEFYTAAQKKALREQAEAYQAKKRK